MRKHYTPDIRANTYADIALSVFIGIVLAYLLFIYL